MHRRKLMSTIVDCLAVGLLLLAFGYMGSTAYAQEQPPDLPCRGCHEELTGELDLSSGEAISLEIPIHALNSSAHSFLNESPVYCTDCHTNRPYEYPHPEVPAETLREYSLWVSESCDNCHYPHRPLHPQESADAPLPACVDCHGSHTIEVAEQIGRPDSTMPANCVNCHTEQSEQWAASLIAPRPGWGEGAEGYIGSDRCTGCHESLSHSWADTLHANTIQDVSARPSAVLGNFQQESDIRSFDLGQVDYVVGSRWRQLYLAADADNKSNLSVLPAQWNMATQEWVAYKPTEANPGEWLQTCAACHVTGMDIDTWTFEEFGVGCESCHGPGEAHAAAPEQVEMFAQVDEQVCGACHSRGHSDEGHPFPVGYQPGDSLTEHFDFVQGEEYFWPDGSARLNNMQYLDWTTSNNSMRASGQVTCVTCHSVHNEGFEPAQLNAPLNDLCVECHGDKAALALHMPYHRVASQRYDFTCANCHMPAMATNTLPFDIHNHTFHQPNPEASLIYGLDEMPNSCTLCHTDQDAAWAMDTINYAKAVTTPAPASLFGPGPTPTSPPPPTPLPSVGQPAPEVQVPSNTWLRYTFLGVIALAILGVVYAFIRIIRSKEPTHA